MRVDSIQNINFGLRKLTSFQDLAKQRGAKITPLESNGVKNFTEYMKNAVTSIKKNANKAIESAKKIFIK